MALLKAHQFYLNHYLMAINQLNCPVMCYKLFVRRSAYKARIVWLLLNISHSIQAEESMSDLLFFGLSLNQIFKSKH